ncbi:MAG TPA: hypothetical protein VFQ44_01365 [Streptosporangiaceae bacterium]|nr:hypothetical protein [Streptosporangiaceae bacterium]
MLVGSGGAISVDPGAIDALAAQISSVAGSTSSVRGSLSGAADAAAGCKDPAAGAFSLLQSLLTGAMACLDDCALRLSSATASGSLAYTGTDAGQMPMTIEGHPVPR